MTVASLKSGTSSLNSYEVREFTQEVQGNNDNINTTSGPLRRRRTSLSSVPSVDRASIYTELSRVTTLTRKVTKTITDIKEAVQDDNRQLAGPTSTGNDSKLDEYNRMLISRFDVGDAITLHRQEEKSNERTDKIGADAKTADLEKNYISSATPSISSDSGSEPQTCSIQVSLKKDDSINHNDNKDKEAKAKEVSVEIKHHKKRKLDQNLLTRVFGNKLTGELELPPDKGYAWVACFCCGLIMFNTWGCNAAFGVFLAYFFNKDVFPGTSNYDYSIIAGLSPAIGNTLAPIAMISIELIGVRPTMTIGTVFLCLAFVLASYAKRFWQLLVTQGFMMGIAMAFAGAPPLAILPNWFLKWRAVAVGGSLFGTGAGGVVYTLASNKMIADHGNTTFCFRVLAIICTICAALCVVLARPRQPMHAKGLKSWRVIKAEFGKMFSLKVMKQIQVQLIALWFTISLFGYSLMIYTISPYAVARGMSQHQGSTLTAIMNGAQSIGRPLMGLAGDRWGRTNITVILSALLAIYMFAFWIPAYSFVQLIFFSILVGSSVGVAAVMNNVLVADMVKPDEYLAAWAYVNSVGSPLILCCELIAQALTDKSHPTNPYFHTQIFTGLCFLVALLLSLTIREIAVRNRLLLRQEETLAKINQKSKCKEMSFHSSSDNDSFSSSSSESTAEVQESWELLNKRKNRYDTLLRGGIIGYFMRMLYPINV